MANLIPGILAPIPGAPAPIKGPSWPKHPTSGHWKLPNGTAMNDTPTETLRTELIRLGIPGAPTDGRDVIVERYAAMLQKIHDDAGAAAVPAWLEQRK